MPKLTRGRRRGGGLSEHNRGSQGCVLRGRVCCVLGIGRGVGAIEWRDFARA